jgi:[acyl-carrier-protein] S-malonyltransferase
MVGGQDDGVTTIFMFPGQSSRYPEMLEKLIEYNGANRAIVRRAGEVLGRDLAQDFRAGNSRLFDRNRDVQIAMFLTNFIHAEMLRRRGGEPDLSLGLSLGEYNHLVDIGALSFEAALRLVDLRGALYDEGPAGVMASVGPIASDELEAAMQEARKLGTVELAVENSPAYHVVGGEQRAVESLLDALEQEHFVSGTIIESRVPMHTSLFAEVAKRFRLHLELVDWQKPHRPYWPNVLARRIENPSAQDFVENLSAHVHRPVRWRQSMEAVVAGHPDAVFVETGPRGVLHNLLQARWIANRKFKTDGDGVNGLEIETICAALGPAGGR